jgi:hypothetical protein
MSFNVFLGFHVLTGLTCVVTGAIAVLSKKRRGRHTRWGTIYFWSFSAVFVSATGLAVLHWATDAYLFVIGAVAFGCASAAYGVRALQLERRIGARSAHTVHITGMGLSYIALLTAFYVDNGPHVPLLREFPTFAFWLLPSAIGLPLVLRAIIRYARRGNNVITVGHAGASPAGVVWYKSDTAHRT